MTPSMHILIVDPSTTRRRMIRGPLDRAVKAAIDEADSGTEALRRLGTIPHPVVITGPDIGDLSAPAFAGQLRRLPGHAATPLLLITPPCSHDDFLLAIDAGYEDCVIVPFEDDVLVQKVERAFETIRQRLAPPQKPRYKHLGLIK